MAATRANIGSAALSAFMFHRAGQPDPVDLLGAMFVIEGLGVRNAAGWADRLGRGLGLADDQLSFLRYHADGRRRALRGAGGRADARACWTTRPGRRSRGPPG